MQSSADRGSAHNRGRASRAGRLRVVLADDDPGDRTAMRDVLVRDGMTVVAAVAGGREATDLARRYQPEVALLDLVMPDGDGLTATRAIAETYPQTCIVLITGAGDEHTGVLGLRYGASGFITKGPDLQTLPTLLRDARDGHAAVSGRLAMALVRDLRRMREDARGLRPVRSPLTDREWEVLDLVCLSWSTEQIAKELVLAPDTVRSHMKNVQRKLGVRNREGAAQIAAGLRERLLRFPVEEA